MRRVLIVVLLMSVAVVPMPGHAETLGRCGGLAPFERGCDVSFPYPEARSTLGMEVWTPFAGEVEIELEGPTGRQVGRCRFAALIGFFLFSCQMESPTGVFTPGERVTLRGRVLGAGSWEVFAETGGLRFDGSNGGARTVHLPIG